MSVTRSSTLWPNSSCFATVLFMHPAPSAIYTLSLHDALPICILDCAFATRFENRRHQGVEDCDGCSDRGIGRRCRDRKSTRLNSSHVSISYAVFCLKKKPEERPDSYRPVLGLFAQLTDAHALG